MLSILGLFNAEVFAMDPLLYMHLPEDRRTASPDRVRVHTADALPSSRLSKINLQPSVISISARSGTCLNLFQLNPDVTEFLRNNNGKFAAVNFGGAVSGEDFSGR